ncbi:nitrate/nitrite porter [Gloeophyllum trabeum ATCC 11539]|uniref:Nitrate/nitrite transporter n=1 Tax=Gloeophyllum trabeum (strain ATCC 11539 / FP-39264 / Madison 617) TaxID=670483 RepID=S7PZR4_GLOTA|nr:nitrate/nitrite porter [Gloeophyllum trabeum ATCC 11539]EPQ53161.1 nitrate/nitrite porter [Gloeophyllum trabeum ATCC 11539]
MERQGRSAGLFKAIVNPVNLKCTTLPILSLNNQYSRNFHLAWLGFFVAFLSWFAFSPLIPDAIKSDLHLTADQIGNSNVVSLCATLIVRIGVGPLVDKYGPRKIMAAMLVIGAVPSGLAGTISTTQGLYIVRFFIGILGGTFVTCQAWTTAFFDKNVVGRANALAGGWGNSGGGFTFMIMIGLYNRFLADGLSSRVAWRVAFAIVPVPVLLFVAAITMIFGTDHPAGKWADRRKLPIAQRRLHEEQAASQEKDIVKEEPSVDVEKASGSGTQVTVAPVGVSPSKSQHCPAEITSELDVAVNRELTWDVAYTTLINPLTWLPSLAYLTTFGYELAIDANLANVLFNLYNSPSFGQTKAGYVSGVYGLINIVTRPMGGYLGDLVYQRYGVPGKKYLTISCGVIQGLLSVGLGVYIDGRPHPSLGVAIVLFLLTALFNEAGNGANFALVPHCNPNSNGLMTGIVGATGNLGGVIFAMIFRFQARPYGKAFWISGVLAIVRS